MNHIYMKEQILNNENRYAQEEVGGLAEMDITVRLA